MKNTIEKYQPLKFGHSKEFCLTSSKKMEKVNSFTTMNIILTNKMLEKEEELKKRFWPNYVDSIFGKKKYRTITCNSNDKEELEEWLESFGCQSEEE